MITSKRKRIKKKIRCGGERLRAEGGKGRAKERPLRGLKEKVTSPFPPLAPAMEMMENPNGFTTLPQPPHTPLFPSDFLPF